MSRKIRGFGSVSSMHGSATELQRGRQLPSWKAFWMIGGRLVRIGAAGDLGVVGEGKNVTAP